MYQCDVSFLLTLDKEKYRKSKNLHYEGLSTLENLHSLIYEKHGLSKAEYYILFNGKKIDVLEDDICTSSQVLHVVPKTFGGKGGFGSMLRAIGAQIEKTTNREACRDLSGRRLRDINEEKRLKNWIAQQAEREKETAERKKKKLERLCQEPKHEFKDEKYEEIRSTVTEKMSSSIDQGLKASTSSQAGPKRKLVDDRSKHLKKKKKTLWIDEKESDTSDSEVDVDIVTGELDTKA